MMSICRVKTISAIIVIVLVLLLQCMLTESHSSARGSIQIHTATPDTMSKLGELTYSGGEYRIISRINAGRRGKTSKRKLCNPGEGVKVPVIKRSYGTHSRTGKSYSYGNCTYHQAFEEVTTPRECHIAYVLLGAAHGGFIAGKSSNFYDVKKIGSKCGLKNRQWFYVQNEGKSCGVEGFDCICLIPECSKCPKNTYSEGGENAKCKPCKTPFLTNKERTRCLDIVGQLDKQKEKQNDLSIKNSRLWQKEEIRMEHDKLMAQRKEEDNKKEKDFCKNEQKKGTIIFPAIEIANEIEKNQDTTCIDTNRDELLKSFCSFTSDLDNLFKIQNIDKEAKTFWPNICCKERNDEDKSKTLESCEPPKGSNIKRENIIPFALSQGGNYNRHNLYVEVSESIKKNGYLHKGMKKLLDSLSAVDSSKKEKANQLVDNFFNEVSLCGPRIVDAPGNSERKLCELFVPYHHAMKNFYNLIEHLYFKPIDVQQSSSFLESMESSLRKRQLNSKKRLGKINNNMQQVIKTKTGQSKPKAEEMCKHVGHPFGPTEVSELKQSHCAGYNHLELSSAEIKNIAIHYLKNDIAYDDKKMFSLKQSLRYEIDDTSCPAAPLFTANDISIQHIAMDVLGEEKDWVAVVNLNTQDKNGYLQSELPFCEDRKYLIGAKVQVKAYVDDSNCCKHVKGYKECEDLCAKKLKKLKDKRHKHYSKDVVLTGTQYSVESSHASRRRRLLQHGRGPC